MCYEKEKPDSKVAIIVLNQRAIQILEMFSDLIKIFQLCKNQRPFLFQRNFSCHMVHNNVIPGSIALNETRTTKLHIVIFADEYFQSVNHLQIDTIKCFSKKKRLQDISTILFSTPKLWTPDFPIPEFWTFQP